MKYSKYILTIIILLILFNEFCLLITNYKLLFLITNY